MNKVQEEVLYRRYKEKYCLPTCVHHKKTMCSLENLASITSDCLVSKKLWVAVNKVDEMFEKDKIKIQGLTWTNEKKCSACGNVVCFQTRNPNKLEAKCWKPKPIMAFPKISEKLSLRGLTFHSKRAGQIGYSFTGSIGEPKNIALSIGCGSYSRGDSGGSYVYRFKENKIQPRPYFYSLKDLGLEDK